MCLAESVKVKQYNCSITEMQSVCRIKLQNNNSNRGIHPQAIREVVISVAVYNFSHLC